MDPIRKDEFPQDMSGLEERDNGAAIIGLVAAALSGSIIGFCVAGYFTLSFIVPVMFAVGCLMGWKANGLARHETGIERIRRPFRQARVAGRRGSSDRS
ncbi:hypothetical protein SIAM614_01174 [Stappia aggregata IAM 12614]|uniref:Uncharacterized protein n=1 Tax=Roseibium aggregatum (strain ATCC 25650 / DSM 13394 / JCM 20685 / NBRC 16684 / NCIMB 2208 / IAM 12614 / B1) TaxID=384765 RepID=A0P0P5_ROSAI|nr:hypothetical protein SIAM614_01174 [Stappia aggregata IAM 12614] [Roseibium aggregatum IAM 12614]